jgi:5-methyltetrahydropteroyltriglutamate--homocysteine methyltransferase
METLVDDIGSFPLPKSVERRTFERAYTLARECIINNKDLKDNEFLLKNFYNVVLNSFRMKLEAGLDVASYPQHYDMRKQFAEVICKAMERGTYIVSDREAVIPEVHVIKEEAKRLAEEFGRKVMLRVCVTGPIELYLHQVGATFYSDVLLMFAETVRKFAKNSILNTKHVETEVIALDEPSFGFRDILADKETIIMVLERSLNFNGALKHIHIHSTSRINDLLEVKNLNAFSVEYASSPQNIESISKAMLEKMDKQIRVGISRTDIDSIMAELYRREIKEINEDQLVESEDIIVSRFKRAKEKFGERMTFAGPDCGLGGWPTQKAAQLLLKKTVDAVKKARGIT